MVRRHIQADTKTFGDVYDGETCAAHRRRGAMARRQAATDRAEGLHATCWSEVERSKRIGEWG